MLAKVLSVIKQTLHAASFAVSVAVHCVLFYGHISSLILLKNSGMDTLYFPTYLNPLENSEFCKR